MTLLFFKEEKSTEAIPLSVHAQTVSVAAVTDMSFQAGIVR